jgi:hypothetical protein
MGRRTSWFGLSFSPRQPNPVPGRDTRVVVDHNVAADGPIDEGIHRWVLATNPVAA